jgi:hypothetical protein
LTTAPIKFADAFVAVPAQLTRQSFAQKRQNFGGKKKRKKKLFLFCF